MKTLFRGRFFGPQSGNRKSKIQNLKWVGFFTFVVALTVCAARAEAQQTGKIFRIGYLDDSTNSRVAVRLERLRQELSNLGWNDGQNITIEPRFAEGKN